MRDHRSRFGAGMLAAFLALAPAACAVGPDFQAPTPPAAQSYLPGPAPVPTSAADDRLGKPQSFDPAMAIPGQWWTLFHSRSLNDLVERSLKKNPNLTAAQAALRQAMENVYAQQGAYYPQVTGSFSATRNKTATGSVSPASASGNPYYSLSTAQLNVSFTPDVFGLNQRTVESLAAQAENQRFQLEATYLTLTSNVVEAAILEASLRAQIDATVATVKIEQDLTDLLRRQFSLGQVAMGDVVAQEAALAQAQQSLPPLQKQLAQQRDLITALAGDFPADEATEHFDLAGFELPLLLPVSVPAALVEQRPDVRAAAETLHAASASIGVAIANRLPQFPLTAFGGSQANKIADLFASGNGFWSLAAGITQPIFEGGTLLHRQRAAVAAFDQASAQYQATVISALQNVADSLRALQYDSDTLKAAVAAADAASRSLEISRTQARLGAVSYLTILNAEQTFQAAKLALAQAQAGRLADTAALFQALGGGWWNRADVAEDTGPHGFFSLN